MRRARPVVDVMGGEGEEGGGGEVIALSLHPTPAAAARGLGRRRGHRRDRCASPRATRGEKLVGADRMGWGRVRM